MNPIVLAEPAVEPVSLADAKAYLRRDGSDEDELIAALIMAGRITVERATRLCMINRQLRLTLRPPGLGTPIPLPLGPIVSLDAVRLVDRTGTVRTLASDAYRADLDRDPAELLVDASAAGATGSAGSAGDVPAVQVDATVGFGAMAAAIPQPLILAVRRLVAIWFEDRGDGPPRASVPGLPRDVQALIAPYRRARLA